MSAAGVWPEVCTQWTGSYHSSTILFKDAHSPRNFDQPLETHRNNANSTAQSGQHQKAHNDVPPHNHTSKSTSTQLQPCQSPSYQPDWPLTGQWRGLKRSKVTLSVCRGGGAPPLTRYQQLASTAPESQAQLEASKPASHMHWVFALSWNRHYCSRMLSNVCYMDRKCGVSVWLRILVTACPHALLSDHYNSGLMMIVIFSSVVDIVSHLVLKELCQGISVFFKQRNPIPKF